MLEAGGHDARRQSEISIVGDTDRLLEILDANDRSNRANHFLAVYAHGVVGFSDQGRLEKPAATVALDQGPA